MALFSQSSPRVGMRSPVPTNGGSVTVRQPVAAPIAASPIRSTTHPLPVTRTPVSIPGRIPAGTTTPRFPTAVPVVDVTGVVGTPAPPVKGTMIPSPQPAPIIQPGTVAPPSLAPQGGAGVIPSQPSGPPPSGAPPSISMPTNTGQGVTAAANPFNLGTALQNPVSIAGTQIPVGWLLLAGVVLVIFLASRKSE